MHPTLNNVACNNMFIQLQIDKSTPIYFITEGDLIRQVDQEEYEEESTFLNHQSMIKISIDIKSVKQLVVCNHLVTFILDL